MKNFEKLPDSLKPMFSQIYNFAQEHYLKNRTIVTSDIPTIFDGINEVINDKLLIHKFHSGEDHGTWIVPEKWDIKEAWVKDLKGNLVASYEEHPLFVSPYSSPVHKQVSLEELKARNSCDPMRPNAFCFNWRYAADASLRLKEWGLSIPSSRIESLNDEFYEVYIDADVCEGDMLVGEYIIKGQSSDEFIFISNYCHPGQVNDSFSGLMLFLMVINELKARKNLRFTYRFLFCQETIGSAIYFASDHKFRENVFGAMFSEMVGWGKDWFIKNSRTGDTFVDKVAHSLTFTYSDLTESEFYSLIGNDEYILNSIQVNIPTLSLQKYDFPQYHTSDDNLEPLDANELKKALDIVLSFVDIIENDRVLKHNVSVPFWMTRYNLYADDEFSPQEFARNLKIVYELLDGKNSVLDIANSLSLPFAEVNDYLLRLEKEKLVEEI